MSYLIDELQALYPDSSRRTLKNWIKFGRVREEGEVIHLERKNDSVLYADKELIVIDKPARLLSVPDATSAPSAQEYLRSRYKTLYPVHRLDRDASGVLLFARTLDMKRKLSKLFHDHEIKREYLALVEGKLEGKGSFSYPLLELESYRVIVSERGRKAVTHYESLSTTEEHSFLRIRLETGRKHQIRVHCQVSGHPLVGDLRYGAKTNPFKRLALHATSLELFHPTRQKLMLFTSRISPRWTQIGAKSR